MQAKDIMTPEPEVLTRAEPVSLAARLMERLDVRLLPVVADRESMRLVGVITDRDIALRHVGRGHTRDCPVRSHMTRAHIDVVRPEDDVRDVMGRMKRTKVRHVPVVGAAHRLVGVISLTDLTEHVGPWEPEHIEDVLAAIKRPTERGGARPVEPAAREVTEPPAEGSSGRRRR